MGGATISARSGCLISLIFSVVNMTEVAMPSGVKFRTMRISLAAARSAARFILVIQNHPRKSAPAAGLAGFAAGVLTSGDRRVHRSKTVASPLMSQVRRGADGSNSRARRMNEPPPRFGRSTAMTTQTALRFNDRIPIDVHTFAARAARSEPIAEVLCINNKSQLGSGNGASASRARSSSARLSASTDG
jgi:hypothetical protein